jgi:hypothetical protein
MEVPNLQPARTLQQPCHSKSSGCRRWQRLFPGSLPIPVNTTPCLALMDMNNDSLGYASQRVARYQPQRYQQNTLLPIDHDIDKFDSIAINYLLHCLPGTLNSKSFVFEHLKTLMKPNATLFGSTLLQGNAPRNVCAQKLMNTYNRKGIFSNQQDGLEDLQIGLATHFESVEIKVTGCVALFSARLVT